MAYFADNGRSGLRVDRVCSAIFTLNASGTAGTRSMERSANARPAEALEDDQVGGSQMPIGNTGDDLVEIATKRRRERRRGANGNRSSKA